MSLNTSLLLNPPPGSRLNSGHPINRGLVGCWLFNEGGGQIAYDLTGINNGTAVSNPTSGVGQFGKDLEFNASNYVSVPDSTSMQIEGAPFSISLWVKTAVQPAAGKLQLILFKAATDASGNGFGWGYDNRTGPTTFDFYKAGVADQTSASITLTSNTWYHLCAVQAFSGGAPSAISFYVNGVLLNTVSNASAYQSTSGKALILGGGANTYSSGTGWNGGLNNVRFYNRVLSAQEIFQLYAQPYSGINVPFVQSYSTSTLAANYITSVGVQKFSITIAAGATTGTATITAVSSLAFIIFGGCVPDATNIASSTASASVTKTNSTTITATRNTSDASLAVTVKGCIVDGTSSLITSVQYGTVTLATGSLTGTATISAVTNTAAAVHLLGLTSDNSSWGQGDFGGLTLSGTTVTFTRAGSFPSIVVSFVVIEFAQAALYRDVQNVATTNTVSTTNFTRALASVNVNNAFIINAGRIFVNANPTLCYMRASLASSTTLQINLNTATTGDKKFRCSVVELIPGILNSNAQRGTTALTASASGTSTITSVTLAQAMLLFNGNTSSSGNVSSSDSMMDVTLTNSTTVTTTTDNSTDNLTSAWEVVEFKAFSGGTTYNDVISETATSSDSETGKATDAASLSETGSATDSAIANETASVVLTETGVSSDLINGVQTINGNMTETIVSSDQFSGIASDSSPLTETGSATDLYVFGASYNDILTESSVSNYSLVGSASDAASLSETVVANDNYGDANPVQSTTTQQTGPADGDEDSWARYLKWLAQRKKKQFKERAEKLGLSPSKARLIAENAAYEASRISVDLRNAEAAQQAILDVYEDVWQQIAVQKREIYAIGSEIERIREEEEEDEFFLVVI